MFPEGETHYQKLKTFSLSQQQALLLNNKIEKNKTKIND